MGGEELHPVGDSEIDGDDYFRVIQSVFLSVSIYDGPDKYEDDLAAYSRPQRLILAYHWYLSEVNNGGHDQFFYNPTAIVWRDAVDSFTTIGHSEVADVLLSAVRRFGEPPSLDHEMRMEQMERVNTYFDDLDEELFRLVESEDFDKNALTFIRAHRSDFYYPPRS